MKILLTLIVVIIGITNIVSVEIALTWVSFHYYGYFSEFYNKMVSLYPSKVTRQIAGRSYEGRNIEGVKISFGPGRKAVFLEGGMHPREFLPPETLTYIIYQLLTNNSPELRQVAESFDWYIFPIVNPDGRVYSDESKKLWSKTRTPHDEPGQYFCYGANPNRNWDNHFGTRGVSRTCSSPNYPGPYAFSEPSTRSLSEFLRSISGNLIAYISFHTFGQKLMVPYGYTRKHLDNYDEAVAIANVATDALARRYGTRYTVGSVAELEATLRSGLSTDWVKSELRTRLVYTYNMRDKGQSGIEIDPDQIIPNAQEVLDSLVALFQEAGRKNVTTLKQRN